MLRYAIALGLLYSCLGQRIENIGVPVIEETNVLSPPYFNIASGKKIDSTATCGTEGRELFCKLTGGTNLEYSNSLHQGQVCDYCNENVPDQAHPIKYAIDGTEKWWQSPPLSRGSEFNKVNITIHLGQVFHVAYVLIKFANSPRAGTWVLERSSDHGKTFQPWQYFANTNSDCYNLFGMDSLEEITRDDSVVCTSDYSSVVPLENGEVIVSMIKGRPGAQNFSYATVLQEWSKATDIRLRLLRTKTLLGHLMAVSEQDPTVTRRYYYSIKDVSVGGRCVCNGHADTCQPDPNDQYKLKCECHHNTCGDSCEQCCVGFEQKAWRAAVPESTNECEACNCHGHSSECVYDEDVAQRRLSLDLHGNYHGGGICQNCQHNTAGINCEQCASGYWRSDSVDPRDPSGCRPCECDRAYTLGSCEPNTGRCYCRIQYAGDRCDRCAPGFYDFPTCLPCDCYYNGTVNDVCLPIDDACPCKYNFAGKYCDECAPGFYNFPECKVCACEGEGVASDVCDPYDGSCPCADGFTGDDCKQCAPGYFSYPLCQRCPCSDIGTTDDVCDPDSGECLCAEKYTGPTCNDCKPGFFDFPRCQECQCTQPGSMDQSCDTQSGQCNCKPNYRGHGCDECAPEYYGYPNCLSCACDVRGSQRTTCDEVTGQCLCFDNIGGQRCDRCNADYFNFPRCEECSCDVRGISTIVSGVCLAFTTGQCDCKENVVGKNCDMCKPLHYDLDKGCVSCNCFIQGTLDGVGECDTEDGQCWCKPYTCTQRCSQCEDGFYSLAELNYLGCTSCQCNVGGSLSSACDKNTGQCECKDGIGGRKCDDALDGFYYPTLYQNQYELEDGLTTDNTEVRYGFNTTQFPGFSMRGYAQFSVVQRRVVVHVFVRNSGLYRILLRYRNQESNHLVGNVTITPDNAPHGSEQSLSVNFEVSSQPKMVTAGTPFVLNRGTWTVVVEAEPGLLVDYLVLLPSQYYEPGILQLSSTVPCIPTLAPTREECVMFTHPSLSAFTNLQLTRGADDSRIHAPSTAHPEMVVMDSLSGVENSDSMDVTINLPNSGEYVLVLQYASNEDRLQRATATVSDGAGNTYNNAKFNIYSCPYSFICRQVALGPIDEVMVFKMSLPTMRVNIKTEAGSSFYVKSLTAIPLSDWNMELVLPRPKCITTQGPEFDECLPSTYDIPFRASRFDPPKTTPPTRQPDGATGDDLVLLDGTGNGTGLTTLQITMNLDPGRYVFLVHYFNPEHTSFNPPILVDGGVAYPGTANVTYCPHSDGCRAVVTTDDGKVVLDITVPTTTFTITVPTDKAFWLHYVLAIPEEDYDPTLLTSAPIDKSGDFVTDCGSDYFYDATIDPTEKCRRDVFSLTVDYNDGGLSCNCSGAGTIGGGDADCEDYGGQCPCKANVIGRQCERCMTGFHGYPDCVPCDCGGAMCDEVSGECICPKNTIAPDCNICAPFTHSFHLIQGCEGCDCNVDGVHNITDRGCDAEDGQCNCKDHVTGMRCDQCEPGYFGFPHCQKCVCDEKGSVSDGCDPVTGQCLCKTNVEGRQCDRCKKDFYFHLDINNPNGCTECFCFGASSQCHSTQYPFTEIYDMNGWRVLFLVNEKPEIYMSNNNQTLSVNVDANGGPEDPSIPSIYWAAPRTYLSDMVGSYGGTLRYHTSWSTGGRGDSDFSSSSPAPLAGALADVEMAGEGYEIGWTNPNPAESASVVLTEANFKHADGKDVTRAEMMMVLNDLRKLHIRASPETGVEVITLQDVVVQTTDYVLPVGSGPTIPSVEECICPDGYHGHSCQFCDDGYRRDQDVGRFLGVCTQCDCFPNCISCSDNGQILDRADCLHNTDGPNCGVCTDGYIGNATSGEIDACKPCPCPYPITGGNFADSCSELDGEVICNCQEGYTGEKCELCANGYFGNPAIHGGSCQPCNCHGNSDPNLIMGCDSLTGECHDCMFNTGGKYCERCADGFHGDAVVARNCTECSCSLCGTEVCDHLMGHCSCKAHVIGNLCKTCEPGFYNFDSCTGCQSCLCAEGALSSDCDVTTGQCDCAPNVVGLRCDRCAPGFWGYSAMGCKPCKCRNNGPCNPTNGLCECPPGITGLQCDQCELARHILHPGDQECTRCGTCTDDLLDEIEPSTAEVEDAIRNLANVSIGVFAYQKLQGLNRQLAEISEGYSSDEGLMSTDTTNIGAIFGGSDLGDMASGSGEMMENSGLPSNMSQPNFEQMILLGEAAVEQMCNQTDALLGMVKATADRTSAGLNHANNLKNITDDFEADTKDLLEKLREEANGDSADYFTKLRDAQMMLQRMQERDFDPMQKIADDELALANELLNRVTYSFTEPASNASNRVGDLSDQLNNTHSKLQDLRAQLNEATQKIIDADTANAVNRKNLTEMSAVIESINNDAAMATELLSDAEQLVNGTKASVDGPITSGTEELGNLGAALEESINELQPVYDRLVSENEMYGPLANQSMAKAQQLKDDAAALEEIVLGQIEPQSAANIYQTIYNSMEKAKTAADEALAAATKAEMDVADKNLQVEADTAAQRSSDLLSDTQEMQDGQLRDLQEDLKNTEDDLDNIVTHSSTLMDRLNKLSGDIAAFDQGGVEDKMASTRSTTADAEMLADQAIKAATALQEEIKNAPDPNTDLEQELAATNTLLDDLPDQISHMDDRATDMQTLAIQLQGMEADLQMTDKLDDIKKRIVLTRNVANSVKSAMKFSSDEALPLQYAKLRLPVTAEGLPHSANLEFYVNVESGAMDNSLMYIGDATGTGGDFMSVETVAGKVEYNFKVGDGVGKLVSEKLIDTGDWHKVIVSRWGNQGRLEIVSSPEVGGRGDDASSSGGEVTEVKEGSTDGGDMVSSGFGPDSVGLYMGGNPLVPLPAPIQNAQVTGACIGDTRLNNATVGMWNFIEYVGPTPGRNCQDRPSSFGSLQPNGLLGAAGLSSQVWRFSGLGSYVRIAGDDTQFLRTGDALHYIGFKIETLQENSLLFLVGENTEQFMALEIVDGDFVMTWNFGFPDGPQNATVKTDVAQHNSPLLIKAGVGIPRNVVLMSVNLRISMREAYVGGNVDIPGDIWIGGLWYDDINPDFRGVLRNIDVSYRGCLSELSFNSRSYDIQNALEKVQVTRGCKKESVQTLQMDGSSFLKTPSGLRNAQTLDGGAVIQSNSPTGTVLSAQDQDGDFVTLSLRDGHLVLSDPDKEIQSSMFYADGRPHIVLFKRDSTDGGLTLSVDDSDKVESATELNRRRRENSDFTNVFFYIGGMDGEPFFTGCIKNMFVSGDPLHPSPTLLTNGMKCGLMGTVCVGKPQYNTCNMEGTVSKYGALNGAPDFDVPAPANFLAQQGLLEQPYELGAEEYNAQLPPECVLPLRPETSGYKYKGDGFSKYWVKKFNPQNWRYSLFAKTNKGRGIIFFMSDTRCVEHIALYLMRGKVVLSIKFGSEDIQIISRTQINDGDWHQITFERKRNSTQLVVDGAIEGHVTLAAESQTFPLNMQFYIGGLNAITKQYAKPFFPKKLYVSDFNGCIQSVKVNSKPIDTVGLGSALRVNVQPCFVGGTESGMYFPVREENQQAAHIVGMHYYNVEINMEVTVDIKPRSNNGIIFAVGSDNGNYFNLVLLRGEVVASLRQGGETLSTTYSPSAFGSDLCDGEWHSIIVTKARNIIALIVDDNLAPYDKGSEENTNCQTNGSLFVGGLPDLAHMDGVPTTEQYVGCMKKLRVDFISVNTYEAMSVHGDITANTCPVN